MRRLLAPAFVTVLACGKTTPKPEIETRNPPAFDDPARDAAALANDSASASGPIATSASPSATARVRGVHKKRKRTAKASFERKEGVSLGESSSTLNPKDDKGRLIQVAGDDSCQVEVPATAPLPGTKNGGPSGLRARDWEEVDCPPELDDPAWDHCTDRIVIDAQSRCFCVTGFGNPPPPPRLLKCPAGATPPKKH